MSTPDEQPSEKKTDCVNTGDQNTPLLPNFCIGPHFEMHPVVFPMAVAVLLALIGLVFFMPGTELETTLNHLRTWIGNSFGWLYVSAMTGFLVFALWLGFGKYGRIRLGKPDEKPEFGRFAWFSMLFSAGMGIGLLFWSVAEPIEHFNTTPPGFADGLNPSRVAMAVTIFHWGLHPWALYAVVGLALAYFGFRHGMPLSFRSLLHPLLGDRVWGFTGDVVDTLAIIATLTGVATSLGLGAQQINAGMLFLMGTPMDTSIQLLLIAGITAIATVSVVLGLGTGIRRLSEANMTLATILMLLVIFGSGVVAFLGSTVENLGAYLQLLPFSSFRTGAINPEGRDWLNLWTVFYWSWWISWSPFVGMFIARISRGRTIREFIVGTLFVPTIVGALWLTAFGATTLRADIEHQRAVEQANAQADTQVNPSEIGNLHAFPVAADTADGSTGIEMVPMTAARYLSSDIVDAESGESLEYQDKLSTVLFVLLENTFPGPVLSTLAIIIATTCIVLFFVTSSDSASMVIDIIASGGNPDPPVGTRLFWAISEGLVAAILLLAGGLGALQAASITAALPFTVILLLTCWALLRALRQDQQLLDAAPPKQ